MLYRYLLQRICTREIGAARILRTTPDCFSSNKDAEEAVRVNKRNIIAHPPTLLVAHGLVISFPTSCSLSSCRMLLKKLLFPLAESPNTDVVSFNRKFRILDTSTLKYLLTVRAMSLLNALPELFPSPFNASR